MNTVRSMAFNVAGPAEVARDGRVIQVDPNRVAESRSQSQQDWNELQRDRRKLYRERQRDVGKGGR